MSVLKNHILLLKTEAARDTTDKYVELLTRSGFIVHQVKTLVFNYKNLPNLTKKLKQPENYSGIIFSSPRCVNAVRLSINDCGESWKFKQNFVVGEATFEAAKTELGLICRGSETGNANNLAALIIKGVVFNSLLLKTSFFCMFNSF